MPDYDQNNVLVGLAKLSVDGTSVGFTSGGVILAATSDRVDKEVDQSYAPVGILKVRERYELRTQLAETTLENLKLVWEQTKAITTDAGGGGTAPSRTLLWGQNENVIEHTLEFIGKSPEGYDRIFSCLKAVVFTVGDVNHVRDGITVIPVTFRILPDTSQASGEEYGYIKDLTGAELAGLAIGTEDAIPETITVAESVSLSVV